MGVETCKIGPSIPEAATVFVASRRTGSRRQESELFRVNQNDYALMIVLALFSSAKHNILFTMAWIVHKPEKKLQKKFIPHWT